MCILIHQVGYYGCWPTRYLEVERAGVLFPPFHQAGYCGKLHIWRTLLTFYRDIPDLWIYWSLRMKEWDSMSMTKISLTLMQLMECNQKFIPNSCLFRRRILSKLRQIWVKISNFWLPESLKEIPFPRTWSTLSLQIFSRCLRRQKPRNKSLLESN